MQETLLQRFTKHEIRTYKEPPRKGVKGNPPGRISAKKNKAAIRMLVAGSQKAIAKEVGVSQGLLLKWRTEEQFRLWVLAYLRKFIMLLMETVRTISQKHSPDNIPKDILAEFSDTMNYSDLLRASIFNCALWIDRKDFFNNGWPIFVIFKDILFSSPSLLRLVLLKHLSEKLSQPQLSEESVSLIRMLIKALLENEEKWFKEGQYEEQIIHPPAPSKSSRKARPTDDDLIEEIIGQVEREEPIFATTLTKPELEFFKEQGWRGSLSSKVLNNNTFCMQLNELMMS